MQIIKDERTENYPVGTCENCQQEKPVRKVQAVGMYQEPRGWFSMCFACFGPRLLWRAGKGMVMSSPIPCQEGE